MSRVPLTIAATECRRTVRVVAGDRTKLLLLGVVALFALGPSLLVGLLLLPVAGEHLAAEGVDAFGPISAVEAVTGATALVWLLLTLMATIRTVTTVADVDEPACLLVSTRLRNVVIGLVGAEVALVAAWVLPPAVILSAAFARGAGTIRPVLVVPAVATLVLLTAVPVGFLLGIWIRHLLTVYEPIARYRTPLIVVVAVAYFGAIAAGWLDAITALLFGLLSGSPLGWPGHLFLVAIPGVPPSPVGVGSAVVGSVLFATLAVAGGVASARVHWFADPARTDDEPTAEVGSADRLGSLLERVGSRPVRAVAVTAIRRTRRAPIRLLYVVYPLFGAIFVVDDVVATGTLPTHVAVLLCFYVVWGAGALFTLNPLGDLGRSLPAVMTSTVSGRQVIQGRLLAGVLVAVPTGLVVALLVGMVSPLSLEQTALLVTGTVVGVVATPALAVGVGSAFPRFGSVRVTNNREAVMPSKTAFVGYTLGLVAPAAAAFVLFIDGTADLLAALTTGLLSFVAGVGVVVPATVVTVAAWVVLALGLVAPLVSYRYAVSRFDGYTLE